jgi:predicted RND superfamily exporter protein
LKLIGKIIARYRVLVILLAVALLVPSVLGFIKTRVNYDILSYLPDTLETVYGQDVLVEDFGSGAFSMVIVEGMDKRDVATLETALEGVDHVEEVLWYDDALGIDVPDEMLPKKVRDIFFHDDATMMIALFDDTTSSEDTMAAIADMRRLVSRQCYISGMAGIVTDIKNLAMQEMPVYVVVAAVLSLLVLLLTTTSFVVPFLFLASIGVAIVYNMGSNVFLGQISYITQALVAVLQLGVTMDYSIFLLHSYETAREHTEDRNAAMGEAISETFLSVIGSSVTTIAGFAALIFMTFALGRDLGVVMIKGVIIGVLCCVTFLPAMILTFENVIERTRHRPFLPNMDGISDFIIKHRLVWILIFLVIVYPAYRGNNDVQLYYNIDKGLPDTLDSAVANKKLSEEFNMSNIHILMADSGMPAKDKNLMLAEIEDVDGVQWVLGLSTISGGMIPEDMLPQRLTEKLRTDKNELMLICSDYASATPEVNAQIAKINDIVHSYDASAMVIGEAPLMKDLEDVNNVDLVRVNTVSVLAIFIIVMFVFKSLTLPAILVTVIEFAIFINMAWSYYTGVQQPFVAPVVVGTIQLGATVDYAILMTSHYVRQRQAGLEKHAAVSAAHRASMVSIITSGLSLFAATVGVAVYSNVDMIKAIVILLARGALISMVVVIMLLPAFLLVFDKVICYTTAGMKKCVQS